LIPTKPGDRRKKDRLDAQDLCVYFGNGLLTPVSVPDAEREAVRGFVRCRQAMREDVTRAKHQLSKFLQLKGCVYHDGSNWTGKHRTWLSRLKFDCEADTETFNCYLSTLDYRQRRLEEIDARIQKISEQEPYREPV
jgi:transposase